MAAQKVPTKSEDKIRGLEAKKLDLQAKIVELKAEVFKIDSALHSAGAAAERINLTLRW